MAEMQKVSMLQGMMSTMMVSKLKKMVRHVVDEAAEMSKDKPVADVAAAIKTAEADVSGVHEKIAQSGSGKLHMLVDKVTEYGKGYMETVKEKYKGLGNFNPEHFQSLAEAKIKGVKKFVLEKVTGQG